MYDSKPPADWTPTRIPSHGKGRLAPLFTSANRPDSYKGRRDRWAQWPPLHLPEQWRKMIAENGVNRVLNMLVAQFAVAELQPHQRSALMAKAQHFVAMLGTHDGK